MIPVYEPFLNGNERKYVNSCLDSTWISSKGEFISRFESEFAKYIGIDHATTVCNGTVALHLAIQTLGLKAGDEVIVPTLTYIASVNTILQSGATPVFVDSLKDTWNIDPEDVEKKITPRTKAIMAVHLYGLPCDMDALTKICKSRGIFLIEDCAEAFGSLYRGRHVGTFGDIATFSFFGNKTITTGEGGMVVTNSKQYLKRASHLKNQGVSQTMEYWHDEIAYNYRMTNICAAIGLAQLEQAEVILSKKREIAKWYQECLHGLPVQFHLEAEHTKHSYWMCSIVVASSGIRQRLRNFLKEARIETRPLFFPAHTKPHCATAQVFSVAEDLASRGINLPSYPALSKEAVEHICEKIRVFYHSQQARSASKSSCDQI